MFDRLTLDSSNSSIPPSSDPNRKKDSKENDDNESGGRIGAPKALVVALSFCRLLGLPKTSFRKNSDSPLYVSVL
jgi:hypothetical protein